MDTRGYLDHFRKGLAAGIADKLKLVTAMFAKKSEKAMVLARNSKEELRDYLSNKFGQSKVVESGNAIGADVANELAYARGYEKGVDLPVPGRDASRNIEGKVEPVVEPPSEPRVPSEPFAPEILRESPLKDPLHYDESERESDLTRGRGGRSLWNPFGDDEP